MKKIASLILVTTEKGRSNLVKVEVASRKIEPLTTGDHDVMGYTATPDASKLAVAIGDATHIVRRRFKTMRVGIQRQQRLNLQAVAGDVLRDIGEKSFGGENLKRTRRGRGGAKQAFSLVEVRQHELGAVSKPQKFAQCAHHAAVVLHAELERLRLVRLAVVHEVHQRHRAWEEGLDVLHVRVVALPRLVVPAHGRGIGAAVGVIQHRRPGGEPAPGTSCDSAR